MLVRWVDIINTVLDYFIAVLHSYSNRYALLHKKTDLLKSIKYKGEKAEYNGKWMCFEVRQDINSMFWQLLLYDLGQIV